MPWKKDLKGKRSSLMFSLESKSQLCKEDLPEAEVERILENEASMRATAREIIRAWREMVPYKCCPSAKFPARRPRLFGCEGEVRVREGLQTKKDEEYYKITMTAEMLNVKSFLPLHLRGLPGFKSFPNFLQALPLESPPMGPADIDTAEEATPDR